MMIAMNRKNYQKELDNLIKNWQTENYVPHLLVHSCCAPCSSYVLEYLSAYAKITVFYYNPNITQQEEYRKRVAELKRLIDTMPFQNPVTLLEGTYEPERFLKACEGLYDEPERGRRCEVCFRLRLQEAAGMAAKIGADYFTTTLTISPLKDAVLLNEIGEEMSGDVGVAFLPSDFKKRGGYQRSIVLSKEYGLYRQNYCGCIFSKKCDKLESVQPEQTEAAPE